jgi:hypothetical protein
MGSNDLEPGSVARPTVLFTLLKKISDEKSTNVKAVVNN